MTIAAAAPSLICELFPAVVVPRAWNAGLSFANASSDVSARGPSSISNIVVVVFAFAAWPFAPFATTVVFTSTGTISSLNFPAAIAASAFLWLASENSSACSRVMPYLRATFSAVRPMLR